MLGPQFTARPERRCRRSGLPQGGTASMPVREKGTNGTGSRASRPASRPRARAERRETAGLSAHRHGIHCTDRLRAGGSRIRTLGPPARVIELGQDATPREIFAYGKAADRSAAPSAGMRFPIARNAPETRGSDLRHNANRSAGPEMTMNASEADYDLVLTGAQICDPA